MEWLKSLLQKLLHFVPESAKKEEKLGLFHWVIILAGLGAAFMIVANSLSIQEDRQVGQHTEVDMAVENYEEVIGRGEKSPSSIQEYEEYLENQLKEILSKVYGVGGVSVMVQIDSTEELVYEQNVSTSESTTEEVDKEGGRRQIENRTREGEVVILRKNNDEVPLVIKTKRPAVRGVLVVAEGADNIQVKAWLIEAVGSVLDVPAHRISVLPRKQ